MSIVITCAGKVQEYFLSEVGNAGVGNGGGSGSVSGLRIANGRIMDGSGKDVTLELDNILGSSVTEGEKSLYADVANKSQVQFITWEENE